MQHKHAYLLFLILIFSFIHAGKGTNRDTGGNGLIEIDIGVILDMESSIGNTSMACIKMALEDFYQTRNYKTKIVPHFRVPKYDRLEAASAAIQLIKEAKVMAIIGPHRSSQADFIVDIGNKAKVPILSLATIPSISPKENPYFIRVSHSSSSQAQPIAHLIKHFNWHHLVFVYQDGDFGTGLIPSLSEALLTVNAHINHRIPISRFASDDDISNKLHDLKRNQTRVFVVHLLPDLASRFFKKAKQLGMMQKGYAWIITDVVTSLLHTLDPSDILDSMQGVVGIKPFIPTSIDLKNFEKRWNATNRVDVFGLWSYDTIYALATAIERIGHATSFHRRKKPVTDLDAIGTSKLGSRLLTEIHKTRLKGLSGDFVLVDGQLQPSDYQIVNIFGQEQKSIDLWTRRGNDYSYKNSLSETIIWPGGSHQKPRGWEIPPTKDSKLKVGYPAKGGFPEFIDQNSKSKPTGFCVDVFEAVMEALRVSNPPPALEYIQFNIEDGVASGTYDALVYQIVREEYDVVIGDVTIRANRSKYVDFTLPYTESGVSMIVPIKKDDRENALIFMKPLEKQLWLTAFGLFIYTGVVVWVLEHRVNREFRGRPYKQVGMIFWFSFSTLVFAHKEKMISNLSRFVVIVWVFVVLVLQSSYIASLTSMLTVQQLQPDFKDIHDLMRQGDNVGYKDGSFVKQMLKDMGFQDMKLKNYSSLQDYDDALSKGSKHGGVSAIFDELPYLKLFLAGHCNKYMMAGPTYKTAGFGFAFPKGSPLLPLVSKALLQVTENNLTDLSKKWFKEGDCSDENKGSGSGAGSGRLSLKSFQGLFIVAGVSSTSALIIYLFIFLYENKSMLQSEGSIRQKLSAVAKTFHQEKNQQEEEEESKKTTSSGPTEDVDDLLATEDGNITSLPPTPQHHQPSDDEAIAATLPPPTHQVVETRN